MPALGQPAPPLQILCFLIIGRHVEVTCGDDEIAGVMLANFAATAATRLEGIPDLRYAVSANEAPCSGYSIERSGHGLVIDARRIDDLLFHFEKDLVVALQELRPELLFLHAAALEHGGRAILLVGASGHGKSTTAWGLLHHGFGYLSDELAPVELDALLVHPYPHALSLKERPPAAFALPAGEAIDLGRTLHVPVAALPAGAGERAVSACPLGAVLFVRFRADRPTPVLRAIGRAEAAVRLYVCTLNALAHPGKGLDAVLQIAERVPCFALDAAELNATCELVSRFAAAGADAAPDGCP